MRITATRLKETCPRLISFNRFGRYSALALGAGFTLLTALSAQAQLTISFVGGTTVSPSSPTLTLQVHNDNVSNAQLIGGINFFFEISPQTSPTSVQPPTIDTTAPDGVNPGPGIDMESGAGWVFHSNRNNDQMSFGGNTSTSQGWEITLQSGKAFSLAANSTATLGTITFNSFPGNGSFPFSFTTPNAQGDTSFFNNLGDNITTVTPTGSITVVPEPRSTLAVGVLLGVFGLWQWKRRKVVA